MTTTSLGSDAAAPGAGLPAEQLEHLRASVERQLPAFLSDLEQLCRIDCGSYSPAGVNEVATWVAAFFAGIGARVERRPDPDGRLGDTVIATLEGRPGAGPRLLLIGHMDTVFDDGTAAARPFRVDDGIARGPGVTDMKGGLLAGLYAIREVVEASGGAGTAGFPFERLVFVANPDEEIGSPSSTPHIRAIAAESDACLVLECARANGDFVSARKGIFDLRVRLHGRAAHAGVEPEKGRSAILAGSHLVTAIHALNGRWPDVTANVGVFNAGTRPNVVPDLAELQVDVRGMTRTSLEAALAAVRDIAAAPGVPDVTTEVETMASWMPMEKLERSGRLAETVIALAARLGFETRDVATGGASDANTTSGMGVPSIDGLGPVGGLDHSPEEYLEVASIVPRTALVAALLLAVAHDPVVAGWRAGPGVTDRIRISSGSRWEGPYGYSRAIVEGDACWVAGTTDPGHDHPGDAAAQARAALAIIEGALTEAGFALADVVRTRMYVTRPEDAAAVATVHGEVFREVRPAATLVVVAALIEPDLLVEIEADAVRRPG